MSPGVTALSSICVRTRSVASTRPKRASYFYFKPKRVRIRVAAPRRFATLTFPEVSTMKRIAILLVAVALPLAAIQVRAHEGHKMAGQATGASKTITGEVVDTGCYLGHAARGEKHVSCATKCINGGMPMGLVTSDGTLYLLTLNHDNADPYNALKRMAGKTVSVQGEVMTRGGMKGIDVASFKPTAAVASK